MFEKRTLVPDGKVGLALEKPGKSAFSSGRGDIALPIVRIETSQKAQRGVHLVDLAAYIDKRRAAAVKECHQLTGQL
jgi:hypothetical protein